MNDFATQEQMKQTVLEAAKMIGISDADALKAWEEAKEAGRMKNLLEAHRLTTEHLVADWLDALRGRRGGLRPSNPRKTHGDLAACVWRIARFHSGQDMTMPVVCWFDLQDHVDSLGLDAKVCGILNPLGKMLTNQIFDAAELICNALGEGNRGIRTWGRAFGLL